MGARIVKQKYNVNNNNTNKNVMIPKKINKKTIEYRDYLLDTIPMVSRQFLHGFIFFLIRRFLSFDI